MGHGNSFGSGRDSGLGGKLGGDPPCDGILPSLEELAGAVDLVLTDIARPGGLGTDLASQTGSTSGGCASCS
jgi:hypothetical protein